MTLHRVTAAAAHQLPCRACKGFGPRGGACTSCGAALASSKRMEPNSLLGSYRVDDVLGEGGMGIVYLATHVRLDRRVAIKVLRSEYAENEHALRRFFAEARAVNTIAHPNVIEITDFVERPGDDNYYVMELLEGASLAALLKEGGIPSLQRSVAIMSQVAAALAAVHEAGIVHRDLKPDNIVLLQRGGISDFVKLVDFGVAKLVGSDDRSVHRGDQQRPMSLSSTSHGTVLGTPEYMSPQQASGRQVDHRGDIYSFGAVLYELVTGRLPHEAESFGELVVMRLTTTPTTPSAIADLPHQIPAALEELIIRCLAIEPEQRPASIEIVMKELEKIAEDQGWLVYELNVRPVESSRAS
ncbi:MAG: serine/threonine protein kinase, partial [Deltaproteobacteria bacterium]|nr:serine/threonine protein kinase [Deltaproteobacteria bacterium]